MCEIHELPSLPVSLKTLTTDENGLEANADPMGKMKRGMKQMGRTGWSIVVRQWYLHTHMVKAI